ncbi:MAG: DUF4350 domain-containing protein [Pseudomonadota bacterium]
MTQSRWLGLIALLLLLTALSAWVWRNFERVEVEVPLPMGSEARANPFYATQRLVTELGGKVVRPTDGLNTLPPTGSTLYLNSSEWSFFPGRAEALQRWVDDGGHLVVPSGLIGESGLAEWLPVTLKADRVARRKTPSLDDDQDEDEEKENEDDHEADEDADADVDADVDELPAILANRLPPKASDCLVLNEKTAANTPPRYPGKLNYQLCLRRLPTRSVHTHSPVQWSVAGPSGLVVLRVPVGQGSVTAHSVSPLFSNQALARADHALLATAILRIAPQREVWFVNDAQREGFLTWLWQVAWVAVLASLLALAAGLWRGLPRFGPRMAAAVPRRRSMGEQLHGNAQFLRRHGPQTLHAAALRALDDTALHQVRHYARLTVSERAQALSQHTGLSQDLLAQALLPEPAALRTGLGALIQVLETARRRLRNQGLEHPGRPAPAATDASPASAPTPASLSRQTPSPEGKDHADPT